MTQATGEVVTACRRTGLFPAGAVEAISSQDFDEIASLPPLWEQVYSQIGRGLYDGDLFMAMTDRLLIGLERSTVGLMIRGCIPRDSAAVSIVLGSEAVCTYRGERVPRPGALIVFSGEEIDLCALTPFDLLTLVGDRNLLEEHALRILGRPLDSLRRNCQGAIHNPQLLEHNIRTVIGGLFGRREQLARSLRDPARAAAFERDMCDLVLGGLAPLRAGPGDTHLAKLALAAERHLRVNLRQEVTIADLCRITGASERTLHLAFRRHIGPSPKAYRKALLLNAARRDLSAGRPKTTVTRVANYWGFKHLSWFAHDYKSLFGESPHDTLCAVALTRHPLAAVSG